MKTVRSFWTYIPIAVMLLFSGCIGQTAETGDAANAAPSVVVRLSQTAGPAPLSVVFDATIVDDGEVTSLLWSFGDGAESTDAHPSHVYSLPGTYNVSLTVFDDDNVSTTAYADVVVYAAAQTTVRILDSTVSITQNVLTITGAVKNEGSSTVSSVRVLATLYDANDTSLGAISNFVTNPVLGPGQTSHFILSGGVPASYDHHQLSLTFGAP